MRDSGTRTPISIRKIDLAQLKQIVKDVGYELLDADEYGADDSDLTRATAAKRRLLLAAMLATTVTTLMVVHMFVITVPGYLAWVALLGRR